MIRNFGRNIETISERSLNILRHIGLSMVLKLASILANFMLVPLSIDYLGTDNFGVWLTLSSVLTWFMLFDIGLGNGLRNKFSEAMAIGEHREAKAFVSTAYFTIAIIGAGLFIVMLIVNQLVDWTVIFNTSKKQANELKLLMPIVFGFFGMQLVLKLITSIYLADQHHSIPEKIQFFTQAGTLVCIALLLQSDSNSLLLFGSIYMASPVLVLFALNCVGFMGCYKAYSPSLSLYKKKHLGDIAGLGLRFFVIQVAAIVLFSTDNFIITQLFGPADVVPYNIAFKYFSVVTLSYGILVAPFWSSFTDAWIKDDKEWIKKAVLKVQKIWLFVPVFLYLLFMLSDYFYRLWVGDEVSVPAEVSASVALFVGIQTSYMVYVQFINGVGAVRLQMITSVVSIVLNIPLSIFFAKTLELGVVGVVLGTCVCLSYSAILRPLQYYKMMNGSAKGIWAE